MPYPWYDFVRTQLKLRHLYLAPQNMDSAKYEYTQIRTLYASDKDMG